MAFTNEKWLELVEDWQPKHDELIRAQGQLFDDRGTIRPARLKEFEGLREQERAARMKMDEFLDRYRLSQRAASLSD